MPDIALASASMGNLHIVDAELELDLGDRPQHRQSSLCRASTSRARHRTSRSAHISQRSSPMFL